MQLNSIVNACNHLYKFWIFKYFSAMHPRVMAELNMFGRKGNKQPFKNTALYEIIEGKLKISFSCITTLST